VVRRRSLRRVDALARLISMVFVGVLAGGCIVSLGQVSGNGESSDTGSGTGTTASIDGGDTTTSSTTSSTTSGGAATSAGAESGSNADDGGDGPSFDIGGGRGASGGESSSGPSEPPPDPPPPYDGDCCVAGEGTGCGDDAVSTCVCADDAYCCDTAWDDLCVAEVTNLGCGICGGARPAGLDVADQCCSAHDGAGCSDPTIADCVCGTDPYCCMIMWDQVCVDEIAEYGCGSCDAGTGTDSGGSSSTT
jgi:hypothetical protein